MTSATWVPQSDIGSFAYAHGIVLYHTIHSFIENFLNPNLGPSGDSAPGLTALEQFPGDPLRYEKTSSSPHSCIVV